MTRASSSGPVAQAMAGNPALAERYAAFREAAHTALGETLSAHVRRAVEEVHRIAGDMPEGEAPQAVLDYARRIPFEHTAITDAEAAQVVETLGEEGYVALSVVAALADAECRAARVSLADLAR